MTEATELEFPDSRWRFAEPEDYGINRARLEKATRDVFGIDKRYGFLVSKDGVIVHEHYLENADATNQIFSLTKGFGGTLMGIAQQQGLLHVDDLVSNWLPVHHPDICGDARIRHLLNMTASRSPAGSWWEYNSAEILNSATGILWLASGMPPATFYERYLRAPLDLAFEWPSNDLGWIQIGSRGPLPVIRATHRDIARLGLLWMNRGVWRGEQIVAADFVAEALTAPYPQSNGAYGYLWWLNGGEGEWRTTAGRSGTGRWFPDAPASMFLGLGARGKVLVVLPDQKIVAVSMGETPREQSSNYLATIVQSVLSLL